MIFDIVTKPVPKNPKFMGDLEMRFGGVYAVIDKEIYKLQRVPLKDEAGGYGPWFWAQLDRGTAIWNSGFSTAEEAIVHVAPGGNSVYHATELVAIENPEDVLTWLQILAKTKKVKGL